MSKSKQEEVVEESEVTIHVKIIPAFALVVESDSTGKKWNGHTWYGASGVDVLRRMRTSMITGPHKHSRIRVTSDAPRLAAAKSWKEPIFD